MGTAYKWGAQCIPHYNSSLNYQGRQKEFPSRLPQRASPGYVIQNNPTAIFLILGYVCVDGCSRSRVGSDRAREEPAAGWERAHSVLAQRWPRARIQWRWPHPLHGSLPAAPRAATESRGPGGPALGKLLLLLHVRRRSPRERPGWTQFLSELAARRFPLTWYMLFTSSCCQCQR